VTDWEALGGEAGVAPLVTAFVERVVADPIIGFLFEGRDLARITRHELEHASVHLGGPLAYQGRPIAAVHRPLRIHAGHFRRRLALLRMVLREHAVDEAIAARWVAHDEALRPVVTGEGSCGPFDGEPPKRTDSDRGLG
jgi:truncated hemoglobin YjbI